jgi:hypothetical protein
MLEAQLEHKFQYEQPLSVEVSRGQRGGYGWTIKIHGDDDDYIVNKVAEIDQRLRGYFLMEGGQNEGEMS